MTSTARPRRLALLDPCPWTRSGMAALCATHPDLSLVIAAETPEAFRRQLNDEPCDVVLMEIACPQTRSAIPGVLALAGHLQRTCPDLPVIIWSREHALLRLLDQMYQHPWRMLCKTITWSQLVPLILRISPPPGARLVPRVLITPRESRILQLYLQGHSGVRIGQRINRSEKTVSDHKLHALSKAGLEDKGGQPASAPPDTASPAACSAERPPLRAPGACSMNRIQDDIQHLLGEAVLTLLQYPGTLSEDSLLRTLEIISAGPISPGRQQTVAGAIALLLSRTPQDDHEHRQEDADKGRPPDEAPYLRQRRFMPFPG